MHAYLIIAHDQLELLEKLVEALDDRDNDIYIHLQCTDKAVPARISQIVQHSNIYFIKPGQISWGAYSQIDCEMRLFEEAVKKGKYEYLHLLSGTDFPLKSQREIHQFFERNQGKEFVHFEGQTFPDYDREKIDCYYPLQEYIGREKKSLFYKLQRCLVHIQLACHMNRHRHDNMAFYKGANWVSITGSFASYLVSRKQRIYELFRYSKCCDEIFLQTMLMNSPYKENLYIGQLNNDYRMCMRYIDWERGKPYVFTDDDYEELIHCDRMFARKFDYERYPQIVDRLLQYIKG